MPVIGQNARTNSRAHHRVLSRANGSTVSVTTSLLANALPSRQSEAPLAKRPASAQKRGAGGVGDVLTQRAVAAMAAWGLDPEEIIEGGPLLSQLRFHARECNIKSSRFQGFLQAKDSLVLCAFR